MRTRSYMVREEHIPERAAFPVIDAHNHLWGNWSVVSSMVATMDQVGVICYCDLTANISLAWADGGYVLSQGSFEGFLASCAERYPGRFYGFTTATLAPPGHGPLFTDAGRFVSETIALLRRHVALGARGLKVLKELGLHYRDGEGNLVQVDDLRLAPIWEEASKLGIPVLIHQSDPVGFFEPVTPENEHYETLTKYPSWGFSDPKFPRKAELMQRRDNLIRRHRNTTFILAHVANMPEDLSYVARLLDENPNVYIDFSARLDELGRQPYSAREFMIRYADRICFGTDMPISLDMYRCYFRFLETLDEFFFAPDYDGTFERHRWPIYGLGLPTEVLKKIYHENVLRLVPGLRELAKIGLIGA